VAIFFALFDDEPDPFGRDIVIPNDLHVREPTLTSGFELSNADAGVQRDPDGRAIREHCGTSDGGSAVLVELAAFANLHDETLQQFAEHLARSPAWELVEERGKRFARRRFLASDEWQTSLHGYAGFGRDWSCQLRIELALDGMPADRRGTVVPPNAGLVHLKIQQGDEATSQTSLLIVQGKTLALSIYESSQSDARPLTRGALLLVQHELEAFSAGKALNVAAVSGSDTDTLEIQRGTQGGMYIVRAHINPGEPGHAILKLYEHTRNTRLSAEQVDLSSQRIVGWSTNPNQRFLYQADITVYEGDWRVYYPARFELWFVPKRGEPPRMLLKDIFRIEGWQR
jgi:hypothetical protein